MLRNLIPKLPGCAAIFMVLFMPVSTLAAADGSWFGQAPPGDEAELFAPGIISNGFNNRDLAMLPDGSEFYTSVNMRGFAVSTILLFRNTAAGWSKPEVAAFATDRQTRYLEPAISPDGSKMFYVAAPAGIDDNMDIWAMDRVGDGWGKPVRLGAAINTPVNETFPSITSDGTLYFSRVSDDPGVEHIYRSRLIDGQYAPAERLPDNVNCGKTQFNAFVAPDESYLIVSVFGREDSLGSIDYYIVYRNAQDQWSEPVNLGAAINTQGSQEYSPYVSRDGKYFFFMSQRQPANDENSDQPWSMDELSAVFNRPENGNSDIYWIDAGFIDGLRPDGF
jgi:hypothetical protein